MEVVDQEGEVSSRSHHSLAVRKSPPFDHPRDHKTQKDPLCPLPIAMSTTSSVLPWPPPLPPPPPNLLLRPTSSLSALALLLRRHGSLFPILLLRETQWSRRKWWSNSSWGFRFHSSKATSATAIPPSSPTPWQLLHEDLPLLQVLSSQTRSRQAPPSYGHPLLLLLRRRRRAEARRGGQHGGRGGAARTGQGFPHLVQDRLGRLHPHRLRGAHLAPGDEVAGTGGRPEDEGPVVPHPARGLLHGVEHRGQRRGQRHGDVGRLGGANPAAGRHDRGRARVLRGLAHGDARHQHDAEGDPRGLRLPGEGHLAVRRAAFFSRRSWYLVAGRLPFPILFTIIKY